MRALREEIRPHLMSTHKRLHQDFVRRGDGHA
jgi:hypothetical protein